MACVHFIPVAATLSDLKEPVRSVFEEAVKKLYPAEVSLETFNSQYLQKHCQDPKAVIAAARASKILNAPVEEVDGTIFSLLNTDIKLGIKVRSPPPPPSHLYFRADVTMCAMYRTPWPP